MPTAVADPANRPVPQVLDYTMPEIKYGQDVLWYPYGDKNQEPSIGKVIGTGQRCIEIMVIGNTNEYKPSVPHISDPRLESSKIQQWGAWEFPPEHQQLNRLLEKMTRMEDRLVALEAQAHESKKGK